MHFNSSARIEVVMKIMRMTRLLRIIRLLHLFPGFRVIITTMFDSLQAIMWLLLFLLLTTYVVSIICTQSLGTKNVGFPGFDDSAEVAYRTEVAGFNNFRYFGTVWKSMISLFHLSMVTDEMTIIIRATNEIYPVATLGLMLFILVVTLGILNTIIGIIVEKTVCVLRVQEADKRKSKLQQLDTIDNLCELMRMIDSDGNGVLTLDELRAAANSPEFKGLLHTIDAPIGFTADDLFNILDTNSNGVVDEREFIRGLFHLSFSSESQRHVHDRLAEARLRRDISALQHEITSQIRQENCRLLDGLQTLMNHALHEARSVNAAPEAGNEESEPRLMEEQSQISSSESIGSDSPSNDLLKSDCGESEMIGFATYARFKSSEFGSTWNNLVRDSLSSRKEAAGDFYVQLEKAEQDLSDLSAELSQEVSLKPIHYESADQDCRILGLSSITKALPVQQSCTSLLHHEHQGQLERKWEQEPQQQQQGKWQWQWHHCDAQSSGGAPDGRKGSCKLCDASVANLEYTGEGSTVIFKL